MNTTAVTARYRLLHIVMVDRIKSGQFARVLRHHSDRTTALGHVSNIKRTLDSLSFQYNGKNPTGVVVDEAGS